ncbi:MAG TPA: GNAT family N-acetyltransferase [Thermoplasmata archaeon]
MRPTNLLCPGPFAQLTTAAPTFDFDAARALLDSDPIGNAVVWDRAFQQPGYEVCVHGSPPRGLIAVHRMGSPGGANFVALHALDAPAAGALGERVPSGFTIVHLTEEFSLPIVEARATEFRPRTAWLFDLDRKDFVDRPDDRVRPLDPEWAGRVAKLWQPDWPAEPYVRRRIEEGPTAAIYEGREPVAWALTHLVTNRAANIGMVHVVEGRRRQGLARAVVAAVSRELLRLGKVPTLHAYADNRASLALFPTLGFQKVKRQVWADAVFP